MSKSPRACNTGPKDDIDVANVGELLLNYVDAIVDDDAVFELYAYAGKKQGSGLDYNALALLEPLIRVFLLAAPSGYFKKTDVRHAMDYTHIHYMEHYMYTYTHTHTHTNTYIHTYIHACIHAYTQHVRHAMEYAHIHYM